jgi:hypothetical protein
MLTEEEIAAAQPAWMQDTPKLKTQFLNQDKRYLEQRLDEKYPGGRFNINDTYYYLPEEINQRHLDD